jgi:hypothetical protein
MNDKISLEIGDLLYTKGGTCIYVSNVEYTDEFNPDGKTVKYITIKFLNGKQEGTTTWREELQIVDMIKEGIYTYLPVRSV